MLVSPSKAQSLARDLVNRLTFRIAASASGRVNQIAQSFDSNGYPILTISRGTLTTTNPVVVLYISPVNAVSTDIFGNVIYAAAPHLTLVGAELGASVKALAGVQLNDLFIILFETLQMGTQFQLVLVPNGTAVTTSAMATAIATNAANTIEFCDWLQWPSKSV